MSQIQVYLTYQRNILFEKKIRNTYRVGHELYADMLGSPISSYRLEIRWMIKAEAKLRKATLFLR